MASLMPVVRATPIVAPRELVMRSQAGGASANYCGDGELCPEYETCDDGNVSNNDGCLASCQFALCGDGFLRQDLLPGEEGMNSVMTVVSRRFVEMTVRCRAAATALRISLRGKSAMMVTVSPRPVLMTSHALSAVSFVLMFRGPDAVTVF